MAEPVLLAGIDLTQADQAAVMAQAGSLEDPALVVRWEGHWSRLWGRPALLFADARALFSCLKQALNWRDGQVLAADGRLHPAWREGCRDNWLRLDFADADPLSGQAVFRDGQRWRLLVHGQGAVAPSQPMDIEDISALLHPFPGAGGGDFQVALLHGHAILPGVETALLLGRDAERMAHMAWLRRQVPGASACALGLSLMAQLPARLKRRRDLALAYDEKLYDRGMYDKPDNPDRNGPRAVGGHGGEDLGGRAWEGYVLRFHDPALRLRAEDFLKRGGIRCGNPLFFKPPASLPGLEHYLRHALALPLYASLSDHAQKRVINRLNRFIEREQSTP